MRPSRTSNGLIVGTEFVIDFADRTLGGSVDDVYDILADVHGVDR